LRMHPGYPSPRATTTTGHGASTKLGLPGKHTMRPDREHDRHEQADHADEQTMTAERFITHCARRATSRAACTAGNRSAIGTAMIAITTSNSMRVKAGRYLGRAGLDTGLSFPRPWSSASRKGTGADVVHRDMPPVMLEAEASHGSPDGPYSGSRVQRYPDTFPRAIARGGMIVRRPPRLQRRSRAGIAPASFPAHSAERPSE
jgi:hypothetical protein